MQRGYVIGIAGGSGSGKTYLVNELCKIVGTENCELISQDDYYIDKITGVVRLNTVSSNDIVAAHYTIGRYDGNEITDLGPDYNPTGTDINPIIVESDECINTINFCEVDDEKEEAFVVR